VSWILAVALTAVALVPLAARAAGGQPPDPAPRLAALAPVAVLVAVAGVAVAAATSWWLALLLAVPAVILLAWQLPPSRRAGQRIARVPPPGQGPGPGALPLRVFSLNCLRGAADPAAVVREVERHQVDVLALQELDPDLAQRMAGAGLDALLPFCHLDPRPGSRGTGLWARWPLTPLPPLPGMEAAAPRARIEPVTGRPVTLTAVHTLAPARHNSRQWQRELAAIRSALMDSDGQQVVAGDFNASRDHRPFRDLLAAGFLDCADAARRRSWPGFTWPANWRIPTFIRLDHVLVSRAGAAVCVSRTIRVPGTDHRAVLAVIELAPDGQPSRL
jgi:endonuclease/exonuclease/phosphatase (EEP) superfamily protein YafD